MSKKRTMICCVTFETVKVADPIIFYHPDSVHLIHYVKDDSPDNMIYQEFYDEVCRRISEWNDIPIIEHKAKVYDYHTILRTVFSIMQEEKDKTILVNVSSGTSEYAAASMMASTMNGNTIPFTVGTEEYTTPSDKLRDLYFENGKAVGLSKKVYEPREVTTFTTESPSVELVACLEIIARSAKEKISGKSSMHIQMLKEAGIWSYETNTAKRKTDDKQKELMYYKRHYIEKLIDNGWIRKDSDLRRYMLTDEGNIILTVFGLKPDRSV